MFADVNDACFDVNDGSVKARMSFDTYSYNVIYVRLNLQKWIHLTDRSALNKQRVDGNEDRFYSINGKC